MSTERRVLLAFALWMLIMVGWNFIWKPKTPPKPPQSPAVSGTTVPAAPVPQQSGNVPPAASAASAAQAATPAPVSAAQEKSVVIENDLYRVEISNRGGVVKSWRLKKFRDHKLNPLELINPEAAQQVGGWPFSLMLEDTQIEGQVNTALFEGLPATEIVHAPTEIALTWSDGHVQVSKKLKFDGGYTVAVQTSVLVDGKPLAHGLAWRGGFGDVSEFAHASQVKVLFRESGKLQAVEEKKLGTPDHREVPLRQIGTMEYAGIEDRYFAAVYLPWSSDPAQWGPGMSLWHWRVERNVIADGKPAKEPIAEMAAGTTVAGPVAFRVYVGPKALDDLRAQRPPLGDLVNFGWFGIISEPLFYVLKWIYRYVPNYGWAIVLMTLAINVVLFPLKVSSWRSMQRMQKVQPEIKQIQDRFKKYSMRDPKKQEMQAEIMAVYKREGINPMGSCLPMVLQMPIWIALYQMLNAAIELRHAPWVLWIHDLSARDPYYLLPILMALTMYISQKMTPATTADPAQQRMMQMMPIMFGGMFIVFPVSSGLVLYILTSNLIGMVQQWYLNRTPPAQNGKDKFDKNKKGAKA